MSCGSCAREHEVCAKCGRKDVIIPRINNQKHQKIPKIKVLNHKRKEDSDEDLDDSEW
jgi:hypothetical protein